MSTKSEFVTAYVTENLDVSGLTAADAVVKAIELNDEALKAWKAKTKGSRKVSANGSRAAFFARLAEGPMTQEDYEAWMVATTANSRRIQGFFLEIVKAVNTAWGSSKKDAPTVSEIEWEDEKAGIKKAA